MKKPPTWFTLIVAIAILWNLVGLFAVIADLRLTAADIAALPMDQQAFYAARPMWSVWASIVAVLGGTVGSIGLLLRKRWSLVQLYASLLGVIIQDIGIFLFAGLASANNMVPLILQGMILLIAIGLILLARYATKNLWLS